MLRKIGRGGGGVILLILDRDVLPANSSYTDADVAYVLIYLNSRSHVSRSELSNYLCMGEGSFRGLLSIMVDAGLVGIHRKGIYMMENGRKTYLRMGIRPVNIDIGFTLGTYNQGIKVIAAASRIGDGMEQVKLSTAYGGVGCTTWVMKNNWIHMPPHWEFSRSNVDASEKIMDEADMHNGDVFLMCGAESPRAARVAAMMVALDLVG